LIDTTQLLQLVGVNNAINTITQAVPKLHPGALDIDELYALDGNIAKAMQQLITLRHAAMCIRAEMLIKIESDECRVG
jgi:hypothetical protein